MLSWGAKRKILIALVVCAIAAAGIFWYVAHSVYRPPSCTDGKKNQGEAGVDCGGPCARLCKVVSLPPIVHWQRAFPVTESVYNVVAYYLDISSADRVKINNFVISKLKLS